jgi:hypothetical protein
VRQQVNGNATPKILQLYQLMPPQISIQQHAMNKQRDRAAALFDIRDPAGARIKLALVRKECVTVHGFCSRVASRSFSAHSWQHTSTMRVPIFT